MGVVSVVLPSPEQLSSEPFNRLLQDHAFSSRLSALGVDEVHLVQDWGVIVRLRGAMVKTRECHLATKIQTYR